MHSKLTKSLLISTSAVIFGLISANTVSHADTTSPTTTDTGQNIKNKTDYQQNINQTQNQIQQLQSQQQTIQQQITQNQNIQQDLQTNQQQLAQAQQTYQQNYTPVNNQNTTLPQAYVDGLKYASEDQQAGQAFRKIANPEVQTHAYTPDSQAAQENIDLSHLTDNQVYRANLFANGLVNRFRQSYGTAPIQQNADAQHYTQQVADALLKTSTTGHSDLLDGAGENLGQSFVYTDPNTAKSMQAVHLNTIKPSDIVMQNHVQSNKQWNTWGFKPGVMITTMDDLYADIYYNVCQMLFNDSGLESWGHATNYLIYNTGKTYTGFAIEPIPTNSTVYVFTTITYADGHKKTTSKPVQVPMIDLITRWQYRANTNKRPINPANDWNDQSQNAKAQINKLTAHQNELKQELNKFKNNQKQLTKINTQLEQLKNKLTQLKADQQKAPEYRTTDHSKVVPLYPGKTDPNKSIISKPDNNPATPVQKTDNSKSTNIQKPATKPTNPSKSTVSNSDNNPTTPVQKTDNNESTNIQKPATKTTDTNKSTLSKPDNKPTIPVQKTDKNKTNISKSTQKPVKEPDITPTNSTSNSTIHSQTLNSNNITFPENTTDSKETETNPSVTTKIKIANQQSIVGSPRVSNNETTQTNILVTNSTQTIHNPSTSLKTTSNNSQSLKNTISRVLTKHYKTPSNNEPKLPQTSNHRSFLETLIGLLVGTDAVTLAKQLKKHHN